MPTTRQIGPVKEWYCQTRSAWGGPWISRPQIDVVSLDWPLSDISTATFRCHYGQIDDGSGTYDYVQPAGEEIAGHWVRIMRPAAEGESGPSPVWHGKIASAADSRGDYSATAGLVGTDLIVAHGMELLLERAAVTTSWTTDGQIKTALPFNIRSKTGFCHKKAAGTAWVGNRSLNEQHVDGGATAMSYVFRDSSDARDWNGRNIVDYLLQRHAPTFIRWVLSGNADNLAAWTGSMAPPPTVLAGIRAIADRRRGHAWRVYVSANEEAAYVEIYSCFGEPVEAGGITLEEAPVKADLDLDAAEIASTPPIIRRDEAHEFDEITVTGAPLVIMATLRAAAGELIAGWPAALETAYNNATASQRGHERFAAVYKVFKADTSKLPAGPDITDEGYIDAEASPGQFWLGKALLSRLPIQADLDDGSDGDESPTDFRTPMILLKATVGGTVIHAPADRPIEPGGLAAGMHVSMIDGEPGIRLTGKHNHYLGMNHFAPAAGKQEPAGREPIFDWSDIVATVAWTSSVPLRVRAKIREAAEAPRALNIAVPTAECWYQMPDTATELSDVNSDGTIQSSGAEILRNDREQLAAVAAMAKAWYERPRRAITVAYDVLDTTFTPGMFIGHADSQSGGSTEVNTLVSRVSWDCDAARTTVQTDFAELDFAAAAGADRPAGGSLGAGAALLSGPDVRDRIGPPITRPADAPPHNPRPVCKIITNAGDGEYTVTAMKWDAAAEDWAVDESDTALTAAPARDWQADDSGQPDDIVHYWTIHDDDGELVVMLDLTVAAATSGGQTETRHYAQVVHMAGAVPTDTDVLLSVPDALNAIVMTYIEIRLCADDGDAGPHPTWRKPTRRITGGAYWDEINTGPDGDDGTWQTLSHTVYDTTGGVKGQDIPTNHFEFRVSTAGTLEIRYVGDGICLSAFYGVCYIVVSLHKYPEGMDYMEFGTGDNGQYPDGPIGIDHEWGIPADPDPPIAVWGDGKWRHL